MLPWQRKNICILSPAFNGAYLGSSMYVSLIKQCSFSCSVLKRFLELLYFDFFFTQQTEIELPSYLNAGSTQSLFDFTMNVQRWFLIRHFLYLI